MASLLQGSLRTPALVEPPMPNAVTYCRVSSEEQAQKDISIPAQRKALIRWAEEQTELRVVDEFVDEGESAYAPADKRPASAA